MSLLTNWLESLSYDLEISEACVKKISPQSSCSVCHDACPAGAIIFDEGKIDIDEKTCTSCGICITVCPTQGIKGQSPSRKVVQTYLLFEEAAPLPSVNELHYFYKKGIRSLHLPSANSDIERLVRSTNDDLESMGMEPLRIAEKLELQPEEQPKLTRRDFFTKITSDSKKTVLASVTPAKWHFNEESFKLSSLYKHWAFHKIELSEENCTLCEACFNICPSKLFEISGTSLKMNEQTCTGCHLCSDICRSNAIKIKRKTHQTTENIKQIQQSICTTCNTKFYTWTQTPTCPICSSRKKNNFFI